MSALLVGQINFIFASFMRKKQLFCEKFALAISGVNYPLPKINSHVINETQTLQTKCNEV